MKRTITLNTFRRVARLEESMMRGVMPLTSAKDASPLVTEFMQPAIPAARPARTWSTGKLTLTLAEVAR